MTLHRRGAVSGGKAMGTGLDLITVINAGGHTSMPLNEFALFRHGRSMDSRHIVATLQGGAWVEQVEAQGVQVLLGHGKLRELSRKVASLAKRRPHETVVHCHHPRTAVPVLLRLRLARAGSRTVFTVHSMYHRYGPLTKLLSIASAILADYVTFVSHAAWLAYPWFVRKLRGKRCCVIQNGVDVDRILRDLESGCHLFPLRPEGGSESLRLICVARMVPAKNLEFLLRVIREVPHSCLTIVGDGPERSRLERLAAELGVERRVRFTGLIPRQQVYAEMASADVFVTSSRYEGLPVALLEAMTVGLPVVASDIPPHREVLYGIPGATLLPGELQAWVAAIDRLRQLPRDELRARGFSNRQVVANRFSLQAMHERYSRVYSGRLDPSGSVGPDRAEHYASGF